MISDNPNVSLENVDCALYTRRIALTDDYHKKRMDMLAYFLVEFNYMETLTKTFIIPARQNQFFRKNFCNNAPVRQIVIAMKTNSAFTGSYTGIVSGINNLVAGKLENPELVNQLSILMLQIMLPLCYDIECNELSRCYPLNSN